MDLLSITQPLADDKRYSRGNLLIPDNISLFLISHIWLWARTSALWRNRHETEAVEPVWKLQINIGIRVQHRTTHNRSERYLPSSILFWRAYSPNFNSPDSNCGLHSASALVCFRRSSSLSIPGRGYLNRSQKLNVVFLYTLLYRAFFGFVTQPTPFLP